jgi:hypothetical protein
MSIYLRLVGGRALYVPRFACRTSAARRGDPPLRAVGSYGDFTLRFQYRAHDDSSAADLVLHASGEADANGRPLEGLTVRLRSVSTANRVSGPPALVGDRRWPGALSTFGAPLPYVLCDSQAAAQVPPAAATWHDCEIEVTGDEARVSLNPRPAPGSPGHARRCGGCDASRPAPGARCCGRPGCGHRSRLAR